MLLEIKCNSQDAGTFFLSNEIGHASDIVVHQFSSSIINFASRKGHFHGPEPSCGLIPNENRAARITERYSHSDQRCGLPGARHGQPKNQFYLRERPVFLLAAKPPNYLPKMRLSRNATSKDDDETSKRIL